MDLCGLLKILGYGEFLKLKEKGITMCHHNLETSREYFD